MRRKPSHRQDADATEANRFGARELSSLRPTKFPAPGAPKEKTRPPFGGAGLLRGGREIPFEM